MAELTLPQVYRRAVEVLDERGWYQGYYVDPEGCKVCVAGALAVVLGGTPTSEDADGPEVIWPAGQDGKALRNYWYRTVDGLAAVVPGGIGQWNDAPRRTVEEVKAALLRAAEEAERDD